MFAKHHNARRVGQQPIEGSNAKIGRNDPCPCGSGKKFKKCCYGVRRPRGGSRQSVDKQLAQSHLAREAESAAFAKQRKAAQAAQLQAMVDAGQAASAVYAFAVIGKLVNNINRASLPAEVVELWDELVKNYCDEHGGDTPQDLTPVLEVPSCFRFSVSPISGAASAT